MSLLTDHTGRLAPAPVPRGRGRASGWIPARANSREWATRTVPKRRCTWATDHLKRPQLPGGWWKGELETNVTMDAEDLLLRHFVGVLGAETLARAAARIRSLQREDGAWATFYRGPVNCPPPWRRT